VTLLHTEKSKSSDTRSRNRCQKPGADYTALFDIILETSSRLEMLLHRTRSRMMTLLSLQISLCPPLTLIFDLLIPKVLPICIEIASLVFKISCSEYI